MRGLNRRGVAVVVAVALAPVVAAAGGAVAVAATTVSKAPLPANAGSNPAINMASVSCTSAGNCTAVGTYGDNSDHRQGLLLTETSGTWAAAEAPLPTGAATKPAVDVLSVSCASVGNCAAVGTYRDNSGHFQGLLLTETSGTWWAAEAPLPAGAGSTPATFLSSVSCAPAGHCTAVGEYHDSSRNTQGLLLTDTSGTWRAARAPLPAGVASNPATSLTSVSCATAGGCTAVGAYDDTSFNIQGLLLTKTSGRWRAAKALPPAGAASNPFTSLHSVSCASAGNCAAVGTYDDGAGLTQGLLLSQTSGTWATGAEAVLPPNAGPNPGVELSSVSCASAGNCTAIGTYNDRSFNSLGLLLSQTSGTWATGIKAPLPTGVASNQGVVLSSVSCALAAHCTAVGSYTDNSGNRQGVLLGQTAAIWAAAKAPLPARAASDPLILLNSVSCSSVGHCTASGDYADSSGHHQGVLLTET
jgi:hypothetical protein